MKTIREELEILGPERVRRAMVAFEHDRRCTDNSRCCFMSHAATPADDAAGQFNAHNDVIRLLGCVPFSMVDRPAVETNFEGWEHQPNHFGGRNVLRLECIAFLAEHGSAPEEHRVPVLVGRSRGTPQ